jgi:hypothetical protein
MNDFMSVLNRLQAAKRKAATREKTQIRSVTVEDEQLHVSQRSGFDDPIQMQQLQQQHRMNLNEIRERQQALASLEQDIGDCNQIFKDLAHSNPIFMKYFPNYLNLEIINNIESLIKKFLF